MLRMNHYRRPAIGLVELLVAMALTIGIMWILAEAFKTGLDMTRELRSTTAMVSSLDGAKAIIAYDLSKDHFPRDDNRPGGGVKLSHQRFDWLTPAGTGWSPPNAGFFRILSPAPTTQIDRCGRVLDEHRDRLRAALHVDPAGGRAEPLHREGRERPDLHEPRRGDRLLPRR